MRPRRIYFIINFGGKYQKCKLQSLIIQHREIFCLLLNSIYHTTHTEALIGLRAETRR